MKMKKETVIRWVRGKYEVTVDGNLFCRCGTLELNVKNAEIPWSTLHPPRRKKK